MATLRWVLVLLTALLLFSPSRALAHSLVERVRLQQASRLRIPSNASSGQVQNTPVPSASVTPLTGGYTEHPMELNTNDGEPEIICITNNNVLNVKKQCLMPQPPPVQPPTPQPPEPSQPAPVPTPETTPSPEPETQAPMPSSQEAAVAPQQQAEAAAPSPPQSEGGSTHSSGKNGCKKDFFTCDPSFEDTVCNQGFCTINTGANLGNGCWTVRKGSVDLVTTAYWQASDGQKSIDMSGNAPGHLASKSISLKGGKYKVMIDYAANPDHPGSKTCNLIVKDVKNKKQLATKQLTFDPNGRTRQNMGWKKVTVYFLLPQDTDVNVIFKSTTDGPWGVAIDNVRLCHTKKPIPETTDDSDDSNEGGEDSSDNSADSNDSGNDDDNNNSDDDNSNDDSNSDDSDD